VCPSCDSECRLRPGARGDSGNRSEPGIGCDALPRQDQGHHTRDLGAGSEPIRRGPASHHVDRERGTGARQTIVIDCRSDERENRGLLNGIAPIPSTGKLTDDLIAVRSRIAPVSGIGQIALVAAPDKAASINLLPRELPHPVLTSASLPSGTVIAIALNAVVSATEGAPRIGASTQAVVHAQAAPATDIGGTPQ
jgi:hypothetical protein